jgi:hypothetical protein
MRKLTAILAALILASAAGMAGAQGVPQGPKNPPKVPRPDKENTGKSSADVMAACALSAETHGEVDEPHLDVWWKVKNESGDNEGPIDIQINVTAFGTTQGNKSTAVDLVPLTSANFPIPQIALSGNQNFVHLNEGDCVGPLCIGAPPPPHNTVMHVVSFKICEGQQPVSALQNAKGVNTEVTALLVKDVEKLNDDVLLGASWCSQIPDPDPDDDVNPPDTENIDIEDIRELCGQL